jgi:iron complex transport system ATP-binding protein
MILSAKNLTIGYGKKIIINNINLNIKHGEIVAIIGPNGSGKSTLMKSLSRFLKPQKGKIYLYEKNIFENNTKNIAKQMAVLPQVTNIPEDLTVEKLISYGRFPHLRYNSRLTKEDYKIVNWAISKTHLKALRKRTVSSLSGGERQRAWIAMTLAQKTKLLLLDEPTTFLDISHQLEVMELIKELNKNLGITVVMVLHDLNQAIRYSHKICAIYNNKIYTYGTSDETITQSFLNSVFNIEAKVYNDYLNNCKYVIPHKILKNKNWN